MDGSRFGIELIELTDVRRDLNPVTPNFFS